MTIIALKSDGDLSWIELNGLTIYIGADDVQVADLCLAITQDLELLRDTVRKKISSIRYQSDMHRDVRDEQIRKLRKALTMAGVPDCQYHALVTLEGIDLMVGFDRESEELETGTPPHLEIMSVTHCGKDMMAFMDTISNTDVFETLANSLGEYPEDYE